MYEVMDNSGQVQEAVSVVVLQEWAASGRLTPDMMLRDPISGQTLPAGQMLAEQQVFRSLPQPASSPQQVQPATALLGRRLAALLIDFLISIPFQIGSCIPVVGLLFAPLLCLYWLSVDSVMGGRSVGKKVMGLQVICLDGRRFTWTHSAMRHFLAALVLIEMLPVIGLVGLLLTGILVVVEIVLILTTGLRLGDRFAGTQVISER